jgi:glycosyltransferase involved in cell wall biosynthesis
MNIYFLTSKLNFTSSGGSIEEIDFIMQELLKAGHSITAVTVYSSRNDIPADRGYQVIEEDIRSRRLLGAQKEIYGLLKKYESKADFFVVDAHLFMYGAGLYRLMGGKVPVGAFVNQFLTCWPQYTSSYFPKQKDSLISSVRKGIRWALEKYLGMWLANHVDIYAFVSPTLRKMYTDFGMRDSDSDIIIGDPIDFAKIRAEGKVTETSYRDRAKKDGPIFLFFSSRMSPGKGFDMFLQGFARVKNKDDFRVVLGGTGPESALVTEMVKQLKLERYVTLPGWVDKEQLYQYYREADIFVQADWWVAGTSISLLYALAFGVPSILPGGGGLQWNAGEGAIYFPYRDAAALARCIERLGADPELRRQLSSNCYERLAKDDMNYPKLIKKFATRMEEIRAGLPAR